MAALSLANLAGAGGGSSVTEALRSATDVKRVAAFEDALARKSVDPSAAARGAVPGPSAAVPPPDAVSASRAQDADARERALRALDLEGAAARTNGGDAILGGLKSLRGAFDVRHGRIDSLMNAGSLDTHGLIQVQMEIAQYTLLVDVSSKLTGKTTQSLDTLMKGQ